MTQRAKLVVAVVGMILAVAAVVLLGRLVCGDVVILYF